MVKKGNALFLALLCVLCLAGCRGRTSCAEIKKSFADHQASYEAAADAILDVAPDRSLSVQKEDPKNERLRVIQVQELFFCSSDPALSEEECESLYAAVEPLFSSAKIKGIAGNAEQIQFSLSLKNGLESSVVYAFGGKEPSASFAIVEQKQLSPKWYAVLARD